MSYRHAFTPCFQHGPHGNPLYPEFDQSCHNCLLATVGKLVDMLDEQHEATQALNTVVHAHQENLIERVFLLEGGDLDEKHTHHHQPPSARFL
jgi:hypothetical protein